MNLALAVGNYGATYCFCRILKCPVRTRITPADDAKEMQKYWNFLK
jgi:hypothetical protein